MMQAFIFLLCKKKHSDVFSILRFLEYVLQKKKSISKCYILFNVLHAFSLWIYLQFLNESFVLLTDWQKDRQTGR